MLNKLVNSYKKYKERKQLRNDYINIITTILTAIPDSDVTLDYYGNYMVNDKNTSLALCCKVSPQDSRGFVRYKNMTVELFDHETFYFWKILKSKYNNNILQEKVDEENRQYLNILDTVEDYKRNYKG